MKIYLALFWLFSCTIYVYILANINLWGIIFDSHPASSGKKIDAIAFTWNAFGFHKRYSCFLCNNCNCSLHHTAESVTCQMYVLIRNFTSVISLWCLKILLILYSIQIPLVTNCSRNIFYFRRFSIKRSWKTSRIWKHENGHFRSCLTLPCDARCGDWCGGVMHTAEFY